MKQKEAKLNSELNINITAYKPNTDLFKNICMSCASKTWTSIEPWIDLRNPLTDEKIRYRQIQKVVIALSSQTLVHFKSQNDQRVAQNYHNHQSHHHRHQKHNHGSGKRRAALDSGCDVGQIARVGVGVGFFLRHGLQIFNRRAQNLKEATGARRSNLASDNPETLRKRRPPAPAGTNASQNPGERAQGSP